jgi:hypothetical protein
MRCVLGSRGTTHKRHVGNLRNAWLAWLALLLLCTATFASAMDLAVQPIQRICVCAAQHAPVYGGAPSSDCVLLRDALKAAGVEWGRAQLCSYDNGAAVNASVDSPASLFYSCYTAPGMNLYTRVVAQLCTATRPGARRRWKTRRKKTKLFDVDQGFLHVPAAHSSPAP